MPRISVIVPIYKAEKYLDTCIESIFAQTFSDFELILVDDNSPDNCPEICDQYMQGDSRVKVIHQENGGVSVARNTGIHYAQGEYLIFIDSDDYIESTYLEKLYQGFKLGADIAICGYYVVWNNHQKNAECVIPNLSSEYMGRIEDIFPNIIDHDLINSPWNKMFKTSILKDQHILFDKGMALGEDLCFNIAYLYYCEKCFLCNLPLYYYVKSNSILSKNITMNYFDIQKNLYITLLGFIRYKKIKYDSYDMLESLLQDTLGTLSISQNSANKDAIYAKIKEILQDDLIRIYSVERQKRMIYYLLKLHSVSLIIAYFKMRNTIGTIVKELLVTARGGVVAS